MSYRPMAGSPTLTNPDMILPDYDRADSPSDERSRSPVMLWNNPQIGNMQFQLPPAQMSYMAGTTPIIYGNGTMLSDIGEVTEVESVVGKGSRRPSSHLSVLSDDAAALRSSPTMGIPPRFKNKTQAVPRGRRSSLESTSTVTTQGQDGGEFADFDDVVSVDDVNFQGDDEESMASSYVEGTPAQEPNPVRRPERQPTEDRFSTSSLSDRAEQILANAKKRLSVGSCLSRCSSLMLIICRPWRATCREPGTRFTTLPCRTARPRHPLSSALHHPFAIPLQAIRECPAILAFKTISPTQAIRCGQLAL